MSLCASMRVARNDVLLWHCVKDGGPLFRQIPQTASRQIGSQTLLSSAKFRQHNEKGSYSMYYFLLLRECRLLPLFGKQLVCSRCFFIFVQHIFHLQNISQKYAIIMVHQCVPPSYMYPKNQTLQIPQMVFFRAMLQWTVFAYKGNQDVNHAQSE